MNYTVYPDPLYTGNNVCSDCEHRFSRIIVPADYDRYDIDIDSLEIPEGKTLVVEQHICLILQEDIDGEVRACNYYNPRNDVGFFSRNPFE